MPYVLVRESFINCYSSVEGLPLNEGKILGERCGVYPDTKDEKSRKLEFSTSVINILNSLEQMGYKVVTSGAFVASQSVNNNKNYFKWWIKVEGLNHSEIRHLAEKIGEQPEHQADTEKLAEFSVPSWLVLNGLEQLGYKVISSSQYVTGQGTFDIKDFVWTLYKNKEDWDHSS